MPSDAPLWVAVGVAVLVSFFALAAGIDVDPVLVFENMTYGEMSIDDGFVITISDADTYYNITGFDWNFSTTNKVYFNGSALYINESGTYLAWHFESFSGSVNTEFHLTLGVNGVTQQECETHRKLGAGGDVGSADAGLHRSIFGPATSGSGCAKPVLHVQRLSSVHAGGDSHSPTGQLGRGFAGPQHKPYR